MSNTLISKIGNLFFNLTNYVYLTGSEISVVCCNFSFMDLVNLTLALTPSCLSMPWIANHLLKDESPASSVLVFFWDQFRKFLAVTKYIKLFVCYWNRYLKSQSSEPDKHQFLLDWFTDLILWYLERLLFEC